MKKKYIAIIISIIFVLGICGFIFLKSQKIPFKSLINDMDNYYITRVTFDNTSFEIQTDSKTGLVLVNNSQNIPILYKQKEGFYQKFKFIDNNLEFIKVIDNPLDYNSLYETIKDILDEDIKEQTIYQNKPIIIDVNDLEYFFDILRDFNNNIDIKTLSTCEVSLNNMTISSLQCRNNNHNLVISFTKTTKEETSFSIIEDIFVKWNS